MKVKKRSGRLESVKVDKIVKAITRCTYTLNNVDPLRIATKTISGLYDGATTEELDRLAIHTAAELIFEEPEYSKLAARLLNVYIHKESRGQGIASFTQSIIFGYKNHLINKDIYEFVLLNSRKLDDTINLEYNDQFEYFGVRTLYDRYLLKHPYTRSVFEIPQYLFLRVALALTDQDIHEAIKLYKVIANLLYMPSSPTLFNSAAIRSQLSSCYLLDSPQDDIDNIYNKYKQIAKLSKFAGGIGVSWSRVRSRGSLIKGTNGHSNGIIPWLKILDSSVSAVNQGGRRKGAACVYLETWHADIEEFLELRNNTGEENRRTYNLNLSNWIPDEFMRRVESNEMWSLFDPNDTPELVDLYGDKFDQVYKKLEEEKKYKSQIAAKELYAKMIRTIAQTGNGWINFKDTSNKLSNQTKKKENIIHLSNLCTEILEVTTTDRVAVCNLGSINLKQYIKYKNNISIGIDWELLRNTVHTVVPSLDRVIDINFYPLEEAKNSNLDWRPIGLGLMGFQDVCFALNISFDSEEALQLSKRISEEIYLAALEASVKLAKKHGKYPKFDDSRISDNKLSMDLWEENGHKILYSKHLINRWNALRKDIKEFGVRNSLLIAIAPTATIASIVGCYECIEPQVSNVLKRETLSGEFIQVNGWLVNKLKELKLWNQSIRDDLKRFDGSIQNIDSIPLEIKQLFRTAWELPQKAIINLAIARAPYIDQSQSLNLFVASPNLSKVSSMYFYAWKAGLKTTYYLRSRPATRIQPATISNVVYKENDNSSDNYESCDMCQ